MMNINRKNMSLKMVLFVIFLMANIVNCQKSDAQGNNKYEARNFIGASSNNFPPMNLLDKDGELTGFGRELSDAVIKSIDGKITHIHSSHWTEVLEWLDSGKADFIHDTGYTKEREKSFDYTDWILEMPEVIFVRPEQYDITGFKSLKGKKVICVNKHITHLYIQQFPDIDCYVVKTPVEGLYELIAGKGDAFIYPKQIILYIIQNLRLGDKIKITGDPLRTLTWGMVVKKGNKELLQLLNEGIAKVKKSGEYDLIYDRWWGKKILAGYSKSELHVFTAVITGISVVFVALVMLLFFNRRLSYRVEQRTAELSDTNKKLSKAMDALWGEMELAKKIQTVLLPDKPRIRGYEIAASCEPSEQVGGDYYDVISVGGYDWIVIGDVSGHGVTAGLIMMMVQTAIHTVLNNNPETEPSRLLSVINKTVYDNIKLMDESKHMTIVVLAAGQEGRFSFSGLHEDILIRRQATGKVEIVESDGMWIGLEPDISGYLSDDTLQMEPGDCMVLFTDGITEAWCEEGKLFGDERLIRIIEESREESAAEIRENIISALETCEKPDDVTMVVMKRK